jgi:hypothetical protein
MMDNMIIDLPEIRLPLDLAWRVKFVEAVEKHAERLGIAGHFNAPRFFGYYFTGAHPVVMAGHWTVMLDEVPLMRRMRQAVERVTGSQFNIASESEGGEPEFMLVHDRHDGTCWLWDFLHGRRFVEASEPVTSWGGDSLLEDASDEALEDGGDAGPKLLGP